MTIGSGGVDIQKSNFLELLDSSRKYFIIPDFQRPYSWDKDSCKTFMDDVRRLVEDPKDYHFFGSITYQTRRDSELIIIDGQQRLTTAILMIMAIYHLADKDNDLTPSKAEEIRDRFLYNRGYGGEAGVDRLKLKPGTSDSEIFQDIYNRAKKPENLKSKLFKSYSYFLGQLKSETRLNDYIEALSRLVIAKIVLAEKGVNAQQIFESINSVGEPLQEGDKIRNFSLMLNNQENRQRVYSEYWTKIEQSLINTKQGVNHIDDFFRYFLASQMSKKIVKKGIYVEFKGFHGDQIKDDSDWSQISGFYELVLRNVEHFLFLKFESDYDPSHNQFHQPFKSRIFRISCLQLEIAFPFIMKLLERFYNGEVDKEQVIDILETTESFLVRRVLVGKSTTSMDTMFHPLDQRIQALMDSQEGATYADCFKYELNRSRNFPKDSEINVADTRLKNRRVLALVLSSWDDRTSKESNLLRRLIGLEDSKHISIEHIMPRKPNPAWKKDLGPDWPHIWDQYLDTLPNLTLTGYNSEYSNKPFKEKLNGAQGFKKSQLRINLESVANHETWNKESLEARAKWWHEVILKLWPYPHSPMYEERLSYPEDQEIPLLTTPLTFFDYGGEAIEPVGFQIKGRERVDLSGRTRWFRLHTQIFDYLADLDGQLMVAFADNDKNAAHIRTSKEHRFVEVGNTGYFLYDTINRRNRIRMIQEAAAIVGLEDDDIMFYYR